MSPVLVISHQLRYARITSAEIKFIYDVSTQSVVYTFQNMRQPPKYVEGLEKIGEHSGKTKCLFGIDRNVGLQKEIVFCVGRR